MNIFNESGQNKINKEFNQIFKNSLLYIKKLKKLEEINKTIPTFKLSYDKKRKDT